MWVKICNEWKNDLLVPCFWSEEVPSWDVFSFVKLFFQPDEVDMDDSHDNSGFLYFFAQISG